MSNKETILAEFDKLIGIEEWKQEHLTLQVYDLEEANAMELEYFLDRLVDLKVLVMKTLRYYKGMEERDGKS